MAVSRPRTAVTTPPTAAPTTSMVPHNEPESAFAVARSSASTRLGSAAADAGSNAALKHAMAARSGYTTQTTASLCTARNPRHSTARAMSATTISRFRSTRSASTPVKGDTTKYVRSCAASRNATASAESVRSSTSPKSATSRNQSPPSEMADATYTLRKSRFRRRSE